jgi:predicted nuclease of predicted toxin-antitoxin system
MDAVPDRHEFDASLGWCAFRRWPRGGASDANICDYAREHGFVLITNDLDFPRMLAHTSKGKPSVILLRGEPLVPELRGEALMRAITECSAELDTGVLQLIDWIALAPTCCH